MSHDFRWSPIASRTSERSASHVIAAAIWRLLLVAFRLTGSSPAQDAHFASQRTIKICNSESGEEEKFT